MASGSRRSRRSREPHEVFIQDVQWIPVTCIMTIIIWSYYAYVIELCSLTVTSNVERAEYLLGYHILFAVFMWAYWQTVFTEIGRVPRKFKMPRAELEKLEQAESEEAYRQILERFAEDLPVTNRTITGAIRYCEQCQHVKPDRAHHCRLCGVCVLKMDHHCAWVNNCVAFTNYKFFILLLGYGVLYWLFVAYTALSYFMGVWNGDLQGIGPFHIFSLIFVAIIFAVGLASLFCYHCWRVLQNRSTLEAFWAPIFRTGADKEGFSLGRYNNFQEVFGEDMKTWFLPVFTSLGDGLVFPVRAQHQLSSCSSICNIQTNSCSSICSTETSATEMPVASRRSSERVKNHRKTRRKQK